MPTEQSLHSYYRNRKVLVVGADGFLGFNCVRALSDVGAEISIVTRRADSRAVGQVARVFRCDLRDRKPLEEAVRDQSVVFDLAGFSGAVECNQDPHRSLDEECHAQLNLFQACANVQQETVLFCSSRLVYGKAQYLPVDEAHPFAPLSIYGVHKITVEHYLNVLGLTRGLRYCILRLSNAYGPYQSPVRKGYGVLNQFIRQACTGGTIRIFGDGRQIRDYIYVRDAISVFLQCAMNPACLGQAYNLGGTQPMSVARAAEEIVRIAGSGRVQFTPWPEDDQTVETGDYYSDMRKLARCIDLTRQIPFEEGVQRSIAYCRQLAADGDP